MQEAKLLRSLCFLLCDSSPDDSEWEAVDALAALKGKKVFGLYFTAKWCGPCHIFSPKLVGFRNEHKDDFQFVMMSWDKSLEEHKTYLSKVKMEVPAVRFDAPLVKELGRRIRVNGIPTLLIFDGEGRFLTADGREHMTVPIRPGRMEKDLGESAGAKCWLGMTAPAQKEQVAQLAEANKALDPVFEKYRDL